MAEGRKRGTGLEGGGREEKEDEHENSRSGKKVRKNTGT